MSPICHICSTFLKRISNDLDILYIIYNKKSKLLAESHFFDHSLPLADIQEGTQV